VIVEALVDEKGEVAAARAISGPTELQEAAVAAAYQWRFSPTTKDGVAKKVIGTITFTFTP
jgi:TonB family protein